VEAVEEAVVAVVVAEGPTMRTTRRWDEAEGAGGTEQLDFAPLPSTHDDPLPYKSNQATVPGRARLQHDHCGTLF
jgi:hypothetical protein